MFEAFEMSILLVLLIFLSPVVGILFSLIMLLFLFGMPLWLIIEYLVNKNRN